MNESRNKVAAQQIEAWSYELAMAITDGEYDNWEKRLSYDKPNVPPGSIRNLVRLTGSLEARLQSRNGRVVFHYGLDGRETRELADGRIQLNMPRDSLPKEIFVEVELDIAEGKTSGNTIHPRYPAWTFIEM
jgi:hypothetical protein